MANIIQAQTNAVQEQKQQAPSVATLLASTLDSNKMRTRFDELLGKRTPQFLSSLTSMVTADKNLQQAFYEAPMTVITAALKAATFDLPIEPSLGYAYIVPFKKNWKGDDGNWHSRMEANFIPGYKGLVQLCLRTGAYSRVPDAVDVREGELISYDRLTGDAEFSWIEDEEVRDQLPIIGYAGYFRMKNGAEKTIYMSLKQIESHEKKNRKGKSMGKGWQDDFDSMARKTVIRRLVGKYGLMSIEYRNTADEQTIAMAQEAAHAFLEDDAPGGEIIIDPATGEVAE